MFLRVSIGIFGLVGGLTLTLVLRGTLHLTNVNIRLFFDLLNVFHLAVEFLEAGLVLGYHVLELTVEVIVQLGVLVVLFRDTKIRVIRHFKSLTSAHERT